jgi:hypothetical protein
MYFVVIRLSVIANKTSGKHANVTNGMNCVFFNYQ